MPEEADTIGARRVLFLASGGRVTGLGHIRRSATLADALRRAGAAVTVCLDGDPGGDLAAGAVSVAGDPGRAVRLARDLRADLVILDSKQLPDDLHRALRDAAGRVGVIDDLGDRADGADLVINGAAYAEEIRYRRQPETTFLLGPRYVLLRDAFVVEPRRRYAPEIGRILITVGGADPAGLSRELICWIRALAPQVKIHVVAGPFFTDPDALRRAGADEVLVDPPDIRDQMVAADVAISGGGQTTYELAAAGTPAVGILTGEDQKRNLQTLNALGVLFDLGRASDPQLQDRLEAAFHRLASPAVRQAMGTAGRTLVDGRGASRVAAVITGTA